MDMLQAPTPSSLLEKRFFEKFERIKDLLQLSDEICCEYLGLTEKQYQRVLAHQMELPYTSIYSFSEALNLNFDFFLNEGFDFLALSLHYKENAKYIPEKYQVAAFSRNRSVLNYLSYIEKNYGWRFRQSILRDLQLSEVALADADQPINILVFNDLTALLRKRGFTYRNLYLVGRNSVCSMKQSSFAHELAKLQDCFQVYELFFSEFVGSVERNCRYSLTKPKEGVFFIKAKSVKDIAAALQLKEIGTKNICTYKCGLLESLPGFAGFPPAQVVETHCVHEGDSECRFRVELPKLLFS